MAEHPFNRKWTSYIVSTKTGTATKDGKFDLEISDAGKFIKGSHDKGSSKNPLDCNDISTTRIVLVEQKTPFGTYTAEINTNLPGVKAKVLAGTVTFPKKAAKKAGEGAGKRQKTGQNDGVWVGTQP